MTDKKIVDLAAARMKRDVEEVMQEVNKPRIPKPLDCDLRPYEALMYFSMGMGNTDPQKDTVCVTVGEKQDYAPPLGTICLTRAQWEELKFEIGCHFDGLSALKNKKSQAKE